MEFKYVVYNAARDGKLRRLKVFLDHRAKDEVQMLVSMRTNGATPLIVACRNGHLDIVEYLLDRCAATVHQVGSVTFDGETIEEAPPLWCAGAAGHLDIVKYLVKHGADVNVTTKTNSTPLRAACFDGHFEIVKFLIENHADYEIANRHGHTCLMIACYKGHLKIARFLLSVGATVNRKSVKGNTALHDCAESGSLDILKLLLGNGAKMDVDSYGMTPLMAASVTGHTHIVEYLIGRLDLVTQWERIDSLELLGATYVDKKRDMPAAVKYWRRALGERYEGGNLKIDKPPPPSPCAAYDFAVEVTTHEHLEEIACDPDAMRMQALLVRERILGPAHPDTSYYIRYRGAVYADTGNFDRCITLWMYALDMQQTILEPLSPMTQSSLLSFAELFGFMMCEGRSRVNRNPPVAFTDILTVFRKAVKEVEAGQILLFRMASNEKDLTYFNRTLIIIMHLVCLLTGIMPVLTEKENVLLRQAVYHLVRLRAVGRNSWSPLHLACSRDSSSVGRYPICSFPSLTVVRLLLEVGANPNVRDVDKNTPLHVLVASKPCRPEVARELLQRGAHIDLVNLDQMTCADLLADSGQAIHEVVNPVPYTSLQCLAARQIRRRNMAYKGRVPPTLESFLDSH